MPLAPPTSKVEFVLERRLQRLAAQLRSVSFHRHGLMIWTSVSLIAVVLAIGSPHVPRFAPLAAPVLLVVFIIGSLLAAWLAWRDRTDLAAAAKHVGERHPELRSAILAAVEQRSDDVGQFSFLQRRVINEALRHAETHDWTREPKREARWLLIGHALALIAALGFSIVVLRAHRPAAGDRAASVRGFEITPGDAEVERGSTVVVAARFGGDLPREAILVSKPTGSAETRAVMQRSLSDPVFAFTLASVDNDVSYHVEHDGHRSRSFALRVYDRPALVRADADLDFPAYTALPKRHIVDTHRVSAVIGTKLNFDFFINKPIDRAVLQAEDKSEVALEATAPSRTQFRLSSVVNQSQHYTLALVDEAGRTNGGVIDVRVEALENRRPELKLIFPRGDQHVSPLEEMHFQAEARDDFGLRDYGFGIGVADAAPTYLSLQKSETVASVQASFEHMLALETQGAKADQLVTWFAWADDVGPDGNVRRTTSDVYFAQVRRLDEIFREDANGGGGNQPGGASGPGDELLEAQRQISIGIWKLRQADSASATFIQDLTTLRDSQTEARQQLAKLRQQLEDARSRAAADQAEPLMQKSLDSLNRALTDKSTSPLEEAWKAARGAYEAVLRMQPRDTNVSQARNRGQGSSGGRKQDQLDELEFRNENDRYETETQAQAVASPEQRAQLSVLARLRELARRQQDLNGRLKELQTALAAAEDEAKRESIRRELKRLEEEQRRMLSEVDETRQRADRLQPGAQTQQLQKQLEQTREDMRRASEQLGEGQVSQALASGSRARENLQRTSEDLRKGAAGRFGEQMREARRQARELAANQQEAMRQLDELNSGQQSLDDSDKREKIATALKEQADRREGLMQNLRSVTDESEGNEPRLHRQLYDLLRQQQQSGVANELNASAELLRRGFVQPARERQAGVQKEFDQLQRSVERAASAVLGDETNELRFAQSELETLTKELQRDRSPSSDGKSSGSPDQAAESKQNAAGQTGSDANAKDAGEKSEQQTSSTSRGQSATARESSSGSPTRPDESGTPGQQAGSATSPSEPANQPGSPGQGGTTGGRNGSASRESLEEVVRSFGSSSQPGQSARGPLTGGGFGDWADRLRTVEELIESPEERQRLAGARYQAEEFRRANQRDGKAPQWEMVEMGVVAPLQEARAWLRRELNRREEPDALRPIDRDPVPERFAESVRKYYEALGDDRVAPKK